MKEYLFTEAIKVKDGKFYDLPMHINRIQETSSFFFQKSIIFNLSEESIPSEKREGLFKCRIIYSDHVISVEYIPYTFRTIKKLSLIKKDDIEYSHKWANRSDLNSLLSGKGESDDILIIKDGLVTDTSFSNVVFEDETRLYTPDSFLLNGMKRQSLLSQGIIKERTIRLEDIASYTNMYLINSMIDLEDAICLPTADLVML